MNRRHFIQNLLLSPVVALFEGTPVPIQAQKQKDRVLAQKTITARFKHFEVGDYQHAVFIENGREVNLWLGRYGLDYFLTEYSNQELVITYQIVWTHIPEAGKIKIERMIDAKAGNRTFQQWLSAKRRGMSDEALEKYYEPKVLQLTRQ